MRIQKKAYQLDIAEDGSFELFDASGEKLLIQNVGIPFLPVTTRAVRWGSPEVVVAGGKRVTFKLKSNCLYDHPQVVLECKDEYIEYYFKGTVKARMALNKWHLFQKGTVINALDCLDFRSHINSPSAYEVHQTILGRRKLGTIGLDANTEDGDLMFAPHPMMFVFRHLAHQMIIAPMELVSGESLQIKMIKGSNILDDFHIQVGDNLYWLAEGETLESPHFMITPSQGLDVYAALARYTAFLVKDKRVKPKTEADIEPWWLTPMWCSWGDQHTCLDSAESVSTAYTAEARMKAVDNISPKMLERVVDVIERHRLPVKTLILDDRWYTKQGDMYVDAAKFPDMRGTVDGLHAKGYKVMAWASLYQFDKECEAFKQHPEWFIVHHYPRNLNSNPEKDIIHLDYSSRQVTEAYLVPLITRLLSSKPGCYNFDGIKFDWPFLIPHNYPYADRNWVGKEKTIYNTQRRVYEIAKSVKKDCLIIGVSPHPFFNDTQDIIRTYDVSTCDTTIHMERGKYVRAMAPGMVPAMDEHVFYQNFFSYMEEAVKLGIPMIYNLLRFNGDGHVYEEDDYRRLKKILDGYVARTPKLKKYLESRRKK
jgi:hypothetical protein